MAVVTDEEVRWWRPSSDNFSAQPQVGETLHRLSWLQLSWLSVVCKQWLTAMVEKAHSPQIMGVDDASPSRLNTRLPERLAHRQRRAFSFEGGYDRGPPEWVDQRYSRGYRMTIRWRQTH